MRFGVLGPLLAEADDGTPIPLTRRSQRATLAVLLLHGSQPVTKSVFIDALWGGSPPGDADTALRVRMSDLRRSLGNADRIVTRPAGYQLVLRPGELDAEIFRELVARGRAALDRGSAEHATRLLDQACLLWRSPPLADVPDTPLTQAPVAELLAHRRDAREWLIDARLALGHHRELLGQIRALVVADPLSEHPYVQLMLALYRSGQKVAALDVYSRLRELTSREFGQDPGPEARQTLQQILEESPTLAARPQVSPAVSLTARPPWTPVCNVPTAVPDFTGRVAVIEALARRMSAESMSVTVLTGPPGIGTTALAIQAAHLAAAEFPDGQLFIDLGSRLRRKDPAEVLSELLGALGVSAGSLPGAPSERAALYRSILANRRVLVLADDAAAAAEVRPLLPGTRGSAVLVTSHSRLADLEGAHSLDVGPMTRAEAIAMLAKVVGREGSNADDAMFADIAVACAGLPLALRVAGARLAADSSLSPADLAAALTTPGNLLSELVIGDLSVASRLAAAWRLLDPDAQHALWLLAHARQASSPPWLVRAITGAPGALRALSDSSLIRQDPVNGQYSLAPLVGSFALSQATPWLGADWADSFGRVTAALTVS